MKLLTTQADREEAATRLRELLGARGEWFCAEVCAGRERAPFALRAGEWEIVAVGNALHFSCWTDAGARAWRVTAWELAGGRLRLRVTRRMGAEHSTLELVARASAREGALAVAAARRAACERMAQTLSAHAPGMKIESARLSAGARRSEPGRYARLLLTRATGAGRRELIAATGAVVSIKAHEIDDVLASALSWWSRLGDSTRARIARGKPRLWLVVSRDLSGAMQERVALLREDVRDAIRLYEDGEMSPSSDKDSSTREGTAAESDSAEAVGEMRLEQAGIGLIDESLSVKSLTPVEIPSLGSLLARATRFGRPPRACLSETAERLVALAPAEIDVIRARRGETVRFNGLAFARVRRVLDVEHVWFGVQGAGQKVLLYEENWRVLVKLIDELKGHRCADAEDARHAYYRAAPEAWLESILRRDITRLDPGLVVSPLHVQLRTSRESAGAGGARPVDLLALRRDGRLVVIELKVSEDAALPIQGADYWRRVEAHRLSGELRRARLFGELEIADEPPLVYAVAPVFRFHRAFHHLSRMIDPAVEMFRFDINEDWRAGVHVVRRTRVN
jgi:hypothetical protein